MGNNPMKNVDPDGRFWWDVHEELIKSAVYSVYGENLNSRGMYHYLSNVSFDQDVVEGGLLPWRYNPLDHMDNNTWAAGFELAEDRVSAGNIVDLGKALHAVEDFYSHSNFEDIAKDVFKTDDIPDFVDAMKNKEFADAWGKKGKTWQYTPDKTEHKENNTDKRPDENSSQSYKERFKRNFTAAKKHSIRVVKQYKKQKDFTKMTEDEREKIEKEGQNFMRGGF